MKKRLISCLCAVCIMALAVSPGAAAYEGGVSVSNAQSDINHIINNVSFEDVFQGMPAASSINSPWDNSSQPVDYSYSIVPEGDGTYNADLSFSLTIDGCTYDFSASGICRENSVNETVSVLSGGLQGISTIYDREYKVYVGFIKSMDCETITAGVTLVPVDGTSADEIVRFSFGGIVITPDMINSSEDEPINNTTDLPDTSATRADTGYVEEDSAYGSFTSASMGDLPSGIASRVGLHYNAGYARAAVTLRTYTGNVDDTFDYLDGSLASYSTSVSEATLGLRRADSSGVNILNLDSLPSGYYYGSDDEDNDGNSDIGQKLMDYAIDVLGIKYSAASVILNMFNNATNGVTLDVDPVYGNSAKMTLTCGLFDRLIFDSDANLTMKVNLTGNGPQTSPFYAYGTVSYTTNVMWPSNYEYYYFETSQAETDNVYFSVN